jgi:RNA polymerase sigma-54 factor
LSLRVSQHLALTPQLQQSIRCCSSTLELAQEVEQMLDDNPFLEVDSDDARAKTSAGPEADTPAQGDDYAADAALTAGAARGASRQSGRPRQRGNEPPTGRATAP